MAQIAMIGLMAAGSALSVAGNIKQGEAAAEAAEYNAQLSEENARLTRLQAGEDEMRERAANKQTMGSIRAQYGASGLRMDGSAADYAQFAAAVGEKNALDIRMHGERQALAYQKEAAIQRKGGESAKSAGILGAVGAGISGLTKIVGVNTGYGMKRTG